MATRALDTVLAARITISRNDADVHQLYRLDHLTRIAKRIAVAASPMRADATEAPARADAGNECSECRVGEPISGARRLDWRRLAYPTEVSLRA